MGRMLTRGQPAAVETIGALLRAGMPQALLLLGPPSVGKTTLGLDVAAALLCHARDAGDRPCRECRGCRLVAHGNHPDLHRVAPAGDAGQVRIDAIRSLLEATALLPVEGAERVVLIEAAHRMNEEAQHALLKTLEEPPAGMTLVLAADEEDRLLPTVRSRAARIRLGPVAMRVIEDLLVAEAGLDPTDAGRIARLVGGRAGLAMAYARSQDALAIRAELSRSLLDLMSRGRAARLAAVRDQVARAAELLAALAPRAVSDEETPMKGRRRSKAARPERPTSASGSGDEATGDDAGSAATTASRAPASERRRAAGALIAVWSDVVRDLVRVRVGDPGSVREPDLLEEYAALAGVLSGRSLIAFLGRLDGAVSRLDGSANAELLLDALALAIPRPASGARAA